MTVNLKSKFSPGFFLFCLIFFIIFCILGSWQVHRYHYKKALLAAYQCRLTGSPKIFAKINEEDDLQFQPVKVTGNYVNELMVLIPNQYQGREGFEVLTPLKLVKEKKLLLIDRGWVAKKNKQSFPQIEAVTGRQVIIGYIKLVNEYQFILGDNKLQKIPLVMQKIDLKEMSEITRQDFYPFVVRLNAKEPHGFVRDWNIATVVPQRHLAYAVQWFGLAVVMLIGYVAFVIKHPSSVSRIKNMREPPSPTRGEGTY